MMSSRTFKIVLPVVLVVGVMATGTGEAGTVYVGAHAGKILLKDNAKDELNEDLYCGGLLVGMDTLDWKQSTLAVEADFSVPLVKGTTVDYGDWSLWTAGLYGALRVGKEAAFLKLKAGLIYENLDVEAPGAEGADDMGLSLGLGGGFRLGERVFIEIEAAVIDEKMGYLRGAVGYLF